MAKLRRSLLLLAAAGIALAQTEPRYVEDILKEEVLPPTVALFQLRQYILNRVAKPPAPASAAQWTSDSKRIREQILKDVVFHGWPKEWIDSPPKFEDLGVTPGNGYQMRKLRYEIVPGFQSTAILYAPLNLRGKIPAILNVNGHVGPPGKSIEYKQKRCITLARNGNAPDGPGDEHSRQAPGRTGARTRTINLHWTQPRGAHHQAAASGGR